MAKAFQTKLDWTEINVDTLSVEHRAAYEVYKQAYKDMKMYREAFEQGMQTLAPSGKRIVFGYNFGKLSIALDEAKAQAAPKAGRASLADFLSAQAATGARA